MKNADAPARERLTLIRLFEELRAVGYENGYDAVRRYAKIWSREHSRQSATQAPDPRSTCGAALCGQAEHAAWRRAKALLSRAHPNVVVVAFANKLARIAWAVLGEGSLLLPRARRWRRSGWSVRACPQPLRVFEPRAHPSPAQRPLTVILGFA